MSMIIGRRQVILAALVLALGTAIFLNWKFSGNGFNVAGVFNTSSALGDASYVANQKVSTTSSTGTYFAQERLARQQAQDTAEEAVKSMTSSISSNSQVAQQAQAAIQSLVNTINTETTIEGLIKAKGFSDCVAFLNTSTNSINVVVKPKSGDTLSASDAAQIMDIVKGQTNLSVNNIHIIPSK